jgi:histidinol-phosphate aminotransferase
MPVSSQYWSDLVRQLDPYVPGEQPKIKGLIKLNTNESPYPPSPQVKALMTEAVIDDLRLYPDPKCSGLKSALATNFSVNKDQVFVGNGSDEVLAFVFQAFFQHTEPVLFPDITYGFYSVYCSLFGIDSVKMPLAEDFSIALGDYQRPNGGIIFPNPNAPTGIGLPLDAIEALLLANSDSVVVVDEAYVDFGSESAIALIGRFPNLLVVQTFSKSRSLAGSRVGFAVGNAGLIEALERVKNSFNPYSIDRLAEIAAVASIEDETYFQHCCKKIITSREWLTQQLTGLGFDVLPSLTNFVMAKPSGVSAEQLFAGLREVNILVRYFQKPRINEYVRISIGTDTEMEALVLALEAILNR